MRPIRSLAPAGALLFAASLSFARPNIFPVAVQRCDDSYDTNRTTNRDSPELRIAIQDTSGLKVGEQPPSVISGLTGEMYRFNSVYHRVDSGCSGGVRSQTYTYFDPAVNITTVTLGNCRYSGLCNALTTLQAPVPLGACPASPQGAAGVTTDIAIPTAGKFGEAFTFNGVNHYGIIPDSVQWDLPASYTLSAWIKSASNGTQRIFSQQNGNYWGFRLLSGGLSHFDSRELDAPTDYRSVVFGSGLNDNNWHHVAVTRANGDKVRFYIDGQLVGSHVAKTTVTFSDSRGNGIASSAFIGSYQGASEFFNGQIDELRLMYGAYSEEGVQTDYNATVHRYSSDSGTSYSPVYTAPPANAYFGGAVDGVTTPVYYKVAGVPVSANNRWQVFAQGKDGLAEVSPPLQITLDNSAPGAPGLTGAATAVNALQWSLAIPSHYCGLPYFNAVYTLKDMRTGLDVAANVAALNPTTAISESLGAVVPNQRHVRAATITDKWGVSQLSGGATVYTWTNAPTLPSASGVSTGSLTLGWNANSNPGYTRYEVTLSLDNFATVASTPVSIADNHATTSQDFAGLAPGTTYYFKIRSFNGQASDFTGDHFSAALNFNAVTVPPVSYLSGVALSTADVRWTWSQVAGVSGYRLYAAAGGPLLIDTNLLAYTSHFLSPNTVYSAQLETYNASGASPRSNTAIVYTLSRAPLAGVVTGVSTKTVTLGWNTNGNPSYTFYEVSLATDAAFGAVVATLPATGGSLSFDGLFPGTTYYGRVRAMNGDQIPTSYAVMAATRTDLDASVSQTAAAFSPYSAAANVIGLWHFDENAGLSAADSSGFANPGGLVCQGTPAQCVTGSTPTYAAGPPDLNSSVEFSGLADTLVSVPDHAVYGFAGSMTLSAWVKPQTSALPDGAGLAVKGTSGNEAFALDIAQIGAQKRYRFTAVPGSSVALATGPIRVGEWEHVVAVFDDAANTSRLYINGEQAASAAVAPSRLINVRPISIGNRQSAAAAYDRGFIGRIDEVRFMNRALSGPEVVDLYRSHFSTALAPNAMPALRITLPPNAFPSAAILLVTNDPLNHPITVPASVLNEGLANAPTGQALIAGSMVEIVPLIGGFPFTGGLGSSATLSFAYADSNNDDLLDGTHPQIPVTALRVYTLNTTVLAWEQLPTTLDRASKRVSAPTPHFSIFALFGATSVGATLSQARAFPIPWQMGASGRFGGGRLTFDKLPPEGSVRIFNLSGEKVAQFSFSGPDAGRKTWDGRNDSGKPVASGLYFAQIQSSADGSTVILKLAVEK